MISLLGFVVIFIIIGSVFLAQSFSVIERQLPDSSVARWSVRFDDTTYELAENSVSPKKLEFTDTNYVLGVQLNQPGDFCSFKVSLVNDGDYDAVLDSIALSDIPDEYVGKVRYTISYDGDDYTETANDLSLPLSTSKSRGHDAVVRVEYLSEADVSETPIDLELTGSFAFSQAK